MKFGKELASQMVQEWQGAYMDYAHLKNQLKDLLRFRQQKALQSNPGLPARSGSLKRRLTMYRAFSGLSARKIGPNEKEDEVILVGEGSENHYQTMFLRSSEDGGQQELHFFRKLDEEFNKVVGFYKKKVEEAKIEADELSKQMDALIALRIRVDRPNRLDSRADYGSSSPATVIASVNGEKQGVSHMDVIHEVEMTIDEADKKKKDNMEFKPASLKVLDHVKINVDPESPVSTMKNIIMSSRSELSFSKEELRKAEENLRKAFIEFYQQLRLLKSYCFLNMLAFSKIMKKYDKMVDKSYLGSSDEVNKLIERLESTFIKHFSNGNRRKGIKSLKPGHKKERHRVTFFLGLFTGCSIALIAAIIVSIHARNLLNHEGRGPYMENIFPLYSLFGFIVLHMIMYGWNTYLWRRFRVNYPFIFGFKPGTELGFREILLLASGLSVLALAAVLSNLDMEMDPSTRSYKTLTELVPLGLVIFYICYYGWGDFKKRSNKCLDSNVYQVLYIVVAIIPFWSRFLQCLRRLFEEKDSMQGLNSLKYLSTIVALVMRTLYDLKRGAFWRVMAASMSGVTTVFNTYWDIVIDWGFLKRKSKNPWLRDKLLLSNKAVYFVAIVVNILLRLVWMQLVLDFHEAPFLHRKAMVAIVASLEIIRRGIWNFFRLENEHFNNVGKYRAFNSVPLPFHYEDEKNM
ncbi:EXS (ERD1/XPR1/SYG1) family protein [Striga asiatica]|uniref:EXS (ERD1/XPR1/SYG1) family protein n=1 Tax=Striga asiatica TaxID=4170 RepID=A0A5A7QL66_STRAF|nr:EXS (ERD1/XPR1/SYG1) family protein [Striga asiatica]